MKLYLWLCIVCILLASLPLPLPLVPILVLLFVSVSAVSHVSVCLSVCSAFRLPRVLSHCLCVQLPSAIRRMLTLTLPNALQPLPLLPPSPCQVLRKCLAKKKEKMFLAAYFCVEFQTFLMLQRFFSVFRLVWGFFVAFLLLLEASKNKNIFGMCGKYVKR